MHHITSLLAQLSPLSFILCITCTVSVHTDQSGRHALHTHTHTHKQIQTFSCFNVICSRTFALTFHSGRCLGGPAFWRAGIKRGRIKWLCNSSSTSDHFIHVMWTHFHRLSVCLTLTPTDGLIDSEEAAAAGHVIWPAHSMMSTIVRFDLRVPRLDYSTHSASLLSRLFRLMRLPPVRSPEVFSKRRYIQ